MTTRRSVRRCSRRLELFYILTIIALVTGLAAVYLLKPGVGFNIDPASIDPGVVAQYTKQAKSMGFVDFIVHIIPSTFFAGFTEGEVLPVLLLSILIGFGLTRVGAAGDPIKKAIDSFSVVLFAVFNFLMKLAPLGAFGGMAFTVAATESAPSARWGCLLSRSTWRAGSSCSSSSTCSRACTASA